MTEDQPLTVVIDGRTIPLGLVPDEPLVRAVVISLFSWRRANADDALPADERMGWWGDAFPVVDGDRIGSRLWLLSREKLLPDVPDRAKEYADEALAWLVADGVAARVDVEAERRGLDGLALACRIYHDDGRLRAEIRFDDVWSFVR